MEIISIIIISVLAFVVALAASMVGGAGLIMTPVLIFFGLPPQIAIGTNWFADSFMCLSSTIKYHKDKHIKLKKILFFSIIAAFSGILGILILLEINEELLSKIISVIVILMALFIIVKNKIGIKQDKTKERNKIIISLTAVILGVYGGFYGGGLGSLLMISLILLYGFDFLTAAANSRIVEFIMSIVIVIGFIVSGLIHWGVVIPYTTASVLGGWFGASIATKIGSVWIRRIFIASAIVVGVVLWIS